jgi:hypothetical protein
MKYCGASTGLFWTASAAACQPCHSTTRRAGYFVGGPCGWTVRMYRAGVRTRRSYVHAGGRAVQSCIHIVRAYAPCVLHASVSHLESPSRRPGRDRPTRMIGRCMPALLKVCRTRPSLCPGHVSPRTLMPHPVCPGPVSPHTCAPSPSFPPARSPMLAFPTSSHSHPRSHPSAYARARARPRPRSVPCSHLASFPPLAPRRPRTGISPHHPSRVLVASCAYVVCPTYGRLYAS